MEPKRHNRVPLGGLVLAMAMAVFSPRAAPQQKKSPKPAVTSIRVTVIVLDSKGNPVNNAGVVLRQASVDQGKLGKPPFDVELHTGKQGTVVAQPFAPGIVVVQVIAKDFETYGQAFIMKDANETVHVKLHPPGRQISIYH